MISFKKFDAGWALEYFQFLVEQGSQSKLQEYYGEHDVGTWHGAGAEAMGLSGEIEHQDFVQVCFGFDARTGEKLVQNAGKEDRTSGWDCTFSPDKSASVLWALSNENDREKIQGCHDKAVAAALEVFQEQAGFALRENAPGRQEKADLLFGIFNHNTSRENDPQLHSHCLLFNSAQRQDGTWASVVSENIYIWGKVADLVYQSSLAHNLQEAGWQCEKDGSYIKVSQVPKAVCTTFSKRGEQIKSILADNPNASRAEREIAFLETRKKKENLPIEELTSRWNAEAAEHQFFPQDCLSKGAKFRALDLPRSAAAALGEASEKDGVLDEQMLWRAAAREGLAFALTKQQIGELVSEMKGQAIELVREVDGIEITRWTTHQVFNTEKFVMENAESRKGEARHVLAAQTVQNAIKNFETKKGFSLSQDQRDALRQTAQNKDGIAVIVGVAGAGKTTAVEALREAYSMEGYSTIGVAPSNAAARQLQDALPGARTVERTLIDIQNGRTKLNAKSVIIVDEAGMVGSVNCAKIIDAADSAGAKIIMVGDHKQLNAVSAGGLFRPLSDNLGHATLSENRRQQEAEHRQAVQDLRDGEAEKALQYHAKLGQVSVAKSNWEAIQSVADQWMADARQVGADKVAALAFRNLDVDAVNAAIREKIQSTGKLGKDHACETISKDGEIKKIQLAEGDRIVFQTTSRKFQTVKGEIAKVENVKPGNKIEVTNEIGEIKQIDLSKVEVRHAYCLTSHKAQGQTFDRAVIYGTGSGNQNSAYVMASRAKEQTSFVFTEHQLQKAAGKLDAEAPVTPPDQRKLDLLDKLEKVFDEKFPENVRQDRRAADRCLEQVGAIQPKTPETQAREVAQDILNKIQPALETMKREQVKETTLDYETRQQFDLSKKLAAQPSMSQKIHEKSKSFELSI